MTSADEQYRSGLGLLANAPTAADWRGGIELVDSAADAGLADAIERRALFECMGVGRPRDWQKAIDSLALAAERGCASAASQIILLAEDRYEAEPSAIDWAALRSRISIIERLRAPASQTISASPLIRTVRGLASPAECQWLIESASPRLERAIVYNNATGESGADPGRTNQFALFNFANLDVIAEMVRTRLAAAIGAPLPCLEVSQVLRYSVGEAFAPHWDYLDPEMLGGEIGQRGQRVVTVLVYLNDDFEGGETNFPELGISHRGRAGDALLFSNVDAQGKPDLRTKHAGCPPTSGEKWLFSQWVRDRIPAA